MPISNVHSGKFGVVDDAHTVRNWSIVDEHAPNAYVASNTLFGTGRRAGVNSWNGSYAFYGHTPPVMPGQMFNFLGYTAPDDDVSGNGIRYSGQAMCESISLSWDWTSGAIINGTVNFQGHLDLTTAVGAEISDLVIPHVPPVVGAKVQYEPLAGGGFNDWECVATAEFNVTSALQQFVNSCTVVGGVIWTGQKSGPIDFTLAVTEQQTLRTKFAKSADLVIRLFVNATEFWELKWVQVQNFTGLTVDRETGAIMQQTVNLNMQGFDPSAASYAAATGHVLRPDGSEFWPTFAATPTTS